MKLSRERKVYVALLALGALAMGVDRLLPAPAAAETAPLTTAQAAPSPPPAAAPKAEPAPAQVAAPSLSVRVRRATAGLDPDARDPFQAGELWPRPRIKEEETTAPASTFEAFLASHKLTALSGPKDSGPDTALISGSTYTVGKRVDGFLLVLMDADGVLLESPSGERRRLELAKPTARGKNKVDVSEPGSDR